MGNSRSSIRKIVGGTPKRMDTLVYSPKGGLESKAKKNQKAFEMVNTNTVGQSIERFFELYDLLPDVLGRGSYAEVRLARYKEGEKAGELAAVKIMRKDEMDDRDLQDVRREVEILKSLNHENIVKVFEYFENSRFVYVVMEYLSGGELYRNIDQLADFTESDTRDIMLTLIHALLYCKEKGIAHRDIKPENILLRQKLFKSKRKKNKPARPVSFKEAKRKYEIALADFGFAIQVGPNKKQDGHAIETQCGTPLFIAPEIIRQDKYNYKCDVWSLGIVCYMLLSGGNLPFPAQNVDQLYEKVLACEWGFYPPNCWDKVSKFGKDFMRRLLVLDPAKRASYEELLKHPWFKDHTGKNQVRAENIDFSPMKRFNMRRKMLKALKAKQAADAFKDLMEDYERSRATDPVMEKYMAVTSLNEFYQNPNIETDAETRALAQIEEEAENARVQSIQIDPKLIQDPSMLNSKYFKGIDDLM